MWTNFAKFSNPTPENDNALDFTWNPDKRKKTFNYLLIQENPKMIDNIELKRLNFWKKVYEQYNGSYDDPKILT